MVIVEHRWILPGGCATVQGSIGTLPGREDRQRHSRAQEAGIVPLPPGIVRIYRHCLFSDCTSGARDRAAGVSGCLGHSLSCLHRAEPHCDVQGNGEGNCSAFDCGGLVRCGLRPDLSPLFRSWDLGECGRRRVERLPEQGAFALVHAVRALLQPRQDAADPDALVGYPPDLQLILRSVPHRAVDGQDFSCFVPRGHTGVVEAQDLPLVVEER